jgi:hypothetical protein
MDFRTLFLPLGLLATLSLNALVAQEGQEPSKQPPSSTEGTKVAQELAEAAKNRIKKVSDTEYTLGDIQFSSATREVRVPAVVNMTEGILEYALVHEHGKTHESLLRTKASPTELNVALLLCHYEPHIKEAAQYLEEPRPETKAKMEAPMEREGANQVRLTLEWTDKDGAKKTAPISAWIRDRQNEKPLKIDHWTYTGSFVSRTGYAAEDDGSHIAIYFDLVALMNLPDPGNRSDDRWNVEKGAVPPLDTPVTVVFSHVQPPPAKSEAAK